MFSCLLKRITLYTYIYFFYVFQPTYQNREIIEETVKTSVPYQPPGKMPSLNNNLSELDTLLQDLSNARYNSHSIERG